MTNTYFHLLDHTLKCASYCVKGCAAQYMLGTTLTNIYMWWAVVFAGKDASRALAKSSTKAEDVKPEWEDLPENEKKVLEEWVTFFTRRYNRVGRVTSS